LALDFGEMVRKNPGHDDFAHVVDEAGDINRIVGLHVGAGGNFTGENGGADAVLPKFAPRKRTLPGKALKILNDGCDHCELADLAHTQIKDSFLNAVDRRTQTIVDGVDQTQQARCQAGIAADDFRDLRSVTLFREQEPVQRLVDAAQRWQRWAAGQL
jgi:hypothetical protein